MIQKRRKNTSSIPRARITPIAHVGTLYTIISFCSVLDVVMESVLMETVVEVVGSVEVESTPVVGETVLVVLPRTETKYILIR